MRVFAFVTICAALFVSSTGFSRAWAPPTRSDGSVDYVRLSAVMRGTETLRARRGFARIAAETVEDCGMTLWLADQAYQWMEAPLLEDDLVTLVLTRAGQCPESEELASAVRWIEDRVQSERDRARRLATVCAKDKKACRAIKEGTIYIGMTREQLILSWGEPGKNNRTVSRAGVHEQLIYGSTLVYLTNGQLSAWQDSGPTR